MSAEDSIAILLGRGIDGQEALDPQEWKRVKARVAWVRETVAALREAQRQMDERCLAAVDRVPEEEFERIAAEEQAKVCAIIDALKAAGEEDKWPRDLYFGGV